MSINPLTSRYQSIEHHCGDCHIEVEFQLQQGQFRHSIFIGQGEQRIDWLRSVAAVVETVENNEIIQSDAVCYPVFQELSIQTDQQNQSTAFLVGQANHIHWSMSVQLDPQHHRLTFEVAARITSAISLDSVASGYQVITSNSQLNQATDLLSIQHESGEYILQSIPQDGQSAVKLNVDDDVLRISPCYDLSRAINRDLNERPQTITWKYLLFRKK